MQAANGIIFNSEDEGMGTLQIGTTSGGGTQTFTTNRPIAVDGETATVNLNGYLVTLNGQIVSLGTNGSGLGNELGVSALTINDTSASANGVLILPGSVNNSNFFGNWIITAGTLNVSSDASLGNTVGPSYEVGQIELNGGTLQAGASFSSVRSLFLGGGSNYDTNGFITSFSGSLTDVQRTLTVVNSSAGTAGAVSFGNFAIGATATLAVNAGSSTSATGGPGTAVTFSNGISRNGDTNLGAPANATFFITPATGSTLGQSGTNGVEVFSSGASAANTNGIVPAWIITDSGGSATTNPYNFLTYNNATGYGITTAYTGTFGASNVVKFSTSASIGSSQAFALNVQNGKTLTINGGNTLTIGDGTDPAGLILEGTTSITGGTLAFGGSEAVISAKSTNTISSAITGTGGLTLSGSGTLVLSGAAGGLSGPIVVDSGTLQLNTANYFPTADGGTSIWLSDVKSSPSAANMTVDANNVISALNSDGDNSKVSIATGVTLTIGDSNNLDSILPSTIAGSGTGSLVKAGTGLLDISGSGGVSFGTGGTVAVDGGALRIGNGLFSTSATTPITVASGAELQYSGNSGSQFNDPIQGNGVFHLIGGTVQLTSTSNNYSGGTVLEVGTTLDVTTANLPTNAVVTNAGGILLFDQSTTGTFTGVMSDGQQAGGANNPNDMSCTLVACSGPTLSGTLIKDDSASGSGGNVIIANVQSYSGMTYIEGGTLTLGAVDTIATSAGVILGRVGGSVCNPSPCSGVTATLALGANNTIAGLGDNPANTTSAVLNGYVLTLAPQMLTSWSFAGAIVDGSAAGGSLVQNGLGTSILTGTSTYTGATAVDAGMLEVNGSITSSSGFTVNSGGTLSGDGTIDPPTMVISSGGTFAPGLPGVPGTSMTVVGNLAFQSGALFLVQVNSTSSTFGIVTGTASLGGTVLAMFEPNTAPQHQYTILETAGLSGTFAGASSTNPNLAVSVSYTNTNALLNITSTLGAGVPLNANQQNVANTLNNFFNSGGTVTQNFGSIFNLTGSSLANALSQLDGEVGADAEFGVFQMMTQFLGFMLDPFVDGRFGNAAGGGSQAIGFAPDENQFLPSDVALAYASILNKAPPVSFQQRWTAWGTSYGGGNFTNGSAAAGSSNVTAQTFGFAGGMDYHYSPNTIFGFALGGSGLNWGLTTGNGTGRSDSFQAGVYGITRAGPAYFASSLAFGNHWMTTNRVALGDQITAGFAAQSYSGRVEGGYRFTALPSFGVTPYGAVQAQDFHTPGYTETDTTGGGLGLSYASMNATDVRTEVGTRLDSPTLVGGMPLILRGRVAWAHDFVGDPALSAAFQSLPGSNFTVNGAPIPHDSALTSAGAELYLTTQLTMLVKFDGELAPGSQTYGGSGTLRYIW